MAGKCGKVVTDSGKTLSCGAVATITTHGFRRAGRASASRRGAAHCWPGLGFAASGLAFAACGGDHVPFLGLSSIMRRTSWTIRSDEHTSELQSLMRRSYAVFCLKQKSKTTHTIILQ